MTGDCITSYRLQRSQLLDRNVTTVTFVILSAVFVSANVTLTDVSREYSQWEGTLQMGIFPELLLKSCVVLPEILLGL